MTSAQQYRCPGSPYAISHAQHLGRMARFYAGCRQCPHRDQTGTHSPRLVRRLAETHPVATPRSHVVGEALAGTLVNDLTPRFIRQVGMALGVELLAARAPEASRAALALVGGDGRPATARVVATLIDALRWTGCDVVDAGAAPAPGLAAAIDHLRADGGVLVGNPLGRSETAGLRFWMHDADGCAFLARCAALAEAPGDDCRARPTRAAGRRERFAAAELYLERLAEEFHGLRPLRFVVSSASPPVLDCLRQLTSRVACRLIECTVCWADLPRQVLAQQAHFGVELGDDGQACRFVDDRGQPVPPQHMGKLLEPVRTDAQGRFWFPEQPRTPDGLRALSAVLVLLSRNDRQFSAVWAGRTSRPDRAS